MERHLFLTGSSGTHKTALLCEALGARLASAGGLATRPARAPSGLLQGLDLVPAAVLGGVEGLERRRFLSYTAGAKTDNEVYRDFGVRLMQEAVWYPYVVLDEIGGFELIIPQFRAALYELLENPMPLIAVVKPASEAELFRQYLGLGDRFTGQVEQFHAWLLQSPDTRILDLDTADRDRVLTDVRLWADEYLN